MADRQSRTFSVGSIRCTSILDGEALYDPEDLFADVPKDAWHPVVADHLNSEGYLPLPYQPVLIEIDGGSILVDAGTGPELAAEWEEPVGETLASLEALGTPADRIDTVVLTHAHPDHVGGLSQIVDGRRAPVFGNARHLISFEEWRYWQTENLPEPSSHMAPVARIHLATLREAGLLDLIDDEIEIAPGVLTFPTPGHTPGHLSVAVGSQGERAIVAGDAVLTDHSLEHPEWYAWAEVDPRRTIETRRALLERAVREDAILTAFHARAIGRVRPQNGAFAVEEIAGSTPDR